MVDDSTNQWNKIKLKIKKKRKYEQTTIPCEVKKYETKSSPATHVVSILLCLKDMWLVGHYSSNAFIFKFPKKKKR